MAVDPRIELAKIYIAFFDRAPDPAGLAFWVSEYQKAFDAGSDPFDILFDISNSFAISDEAKALYPQLGASDLGDINSFIFDAYQNLFGRAPDAEGLAYWAGRVQEELAAGRPVGSILVDLQSGAQDSGFGADLATLNNKVTVGLTYVDQFTASGAEWTAADDLAGSKSVVSEVNGTPESVTAANDKIEAIVEEQTGPTEPPVDPTDPGENPGNPGGGGPVTPPAPETFTAAKSFGDLGLGANQAGDLFVGGGNPASGFVKTTILGSMGTTIEIGLDARYRGDLTDIQLYHDGDQGRSIFDVEGNGTRFAYSVASSAALDLTKFEYKLLIDTDEGVGVSNVEFILQADPGAGSPYKWVSASGDIIDDGGSALVTQNIQNLGWLADSNLAPGAVHDITLQVVNRATNTVIGESAITLADIQEITSGALSVGDNNGTLYAGSGNPNEAFSIVSSGGVELGISGRYTQNIVPVEGQLQEDGRVHFQMNDGSNLRFAYSVASEQDFSDLVFKMKIDVNGDSSATDFVEFTRDATTGDWVRDNGGSITDDEGTANVAQNIQNIGWYDADTTSGFLAAGEYEVVLEAYRADGVTLIAQNSVVFDVSTVG